MLDPALAVLTFSIVSTGLVIIATIGSGIETYDVVKAVVALAVFAGAHSLGIDVRRGGLKERILGTLVALTIPMCVAGVVVPLLAAADARDDLSFEAVFGLRIALGAPLRVGGIALLIWTNVLFFNQGRGTLSPQPELETMGLVMEGPFEYARNPMILGVTLEIAGAALIDGSPRVLAFLVMFFVIKNMWFSWVEEPRLLTKFGGVYADYSKGVRRWGLF
mmetsp:Transcript_5808/g.12736  ORF Transcript_5808/g.12736 Transcript_5808/m.12736 type:complete len:220 (-) Transcript_5808:138-797(-)